MPLTNVPCSTLFFCMVKKISQIEITGKLSHSGYVNFMERKVHSHSKIFPVLVLAKE